MSFHSFFVSNDGLPKNGGGNVCLCLEHIIILLKKNICRVSSARLGFRLAHVVDGILLENVPLLSARSETTCPAALPSILNSERERKVHVYRCLS